MRGPTGPTAPWADEDETVYPFILHRTASVLADRLDRRSSLLRSETVTADDVILEIRRQIADCVLDDPIRASDLVELLLELLWSKENTVKL